MKGNKKEPNNKMALLEVAERNIKKTELYIKISMGIIILNIAIILWNILRRL